MAIEIEKDRFLLSYKRNMRGLEEGAKYLNGANMELLPLIELEHIY